MAAFCAVVPHPPWGGVLPPLRRCADFPVLPLGRNSPAPHRGTAAPCGTTPQNPSSRSGLTAKPAALEAVRYFPEGSPSSSAMLFLN